MNDLSHVDESSGSVQMVDVGHKPAVRRKAVARGAVLMAPQTSRRLRDLPKGEGRVDIVACAEVTAKTGVEMEALTAVAVAGLTVYDMAKAIDKNMTITEITLVSKEKETA